VGFKIFRYGDFMKYIITFFAFIICFSLLMPRGLLAQDDVASAISEDVAEPWIVRCNNEGDIELEEKRGKCEIFQRLSLKDTGQRVVEMAIGFPEDKETARGIFILPLGILLQPGVTMQIDDNAPLKFAVRYCVPNGCVAYVNLNDAILDMLKKGNQANVIVKQASGEDITLPIVLKGITKALGEIN